MPGSQEDLHQPLLPNATTLNLKSIPTTNPDETKRIAEVIQNLLGSLSKLGAKIPKPILAGLLISAWGIPIVLDLSLQEGTGSILSQLLNKENIGNLVSALCSGIGYLSVYKGSQLYKASEEAKNKSNGISQLTVQLEPNSSIQELYNNNILIAAQLIVAERERADLTRKLEIKEAVIAELLEQPYSASTPHKQRLTSLRDSAKISRTPSVLRLFEATTAADDSQSNSHEQKDASPLLRAVPSTLDDSDMTTTNSNSTVRSAPIASL
jgi:hypothetical protein